MIDQIVVTNNQRQGVIVNAGNKLGIAALETSADLNMILMEMEQGFSAQECLLASFLANG